MRLARQLPEEQILANNAAFGCGAEIGRQGLRVISVCPSEVQTAWGEARLAATGRLMETKLV